MEIKHTPIQGLLEIYPKVFPDHRGWFTELYKPETQKLLGGLAGSVNFVQDNLSFSKKGVVRGLHFQLSPFQQAKFVTVITGRVLDVVVDLRKGSSSFGQVYTCMLDSKLHNMLIIPEGFAHGFSAQEDSVFFYKCSNVYNSQGETGIRWNDPELDIEWGIEEPILSEKDHHLPTLKELLIKSGISQN